MPAVPVPLSPSLADLRAIAAPAVQDHRVMPFGIANLDARLGGGLRAGALHEAAALAATLADDAATTLFLAGIAAREASGRGQPVLWATCRTDLYALGLAQAGLVASDVIYAETRDDAQLLAVVEDAVRDGTPAAVIGEVARLPMAATRRLQIVAADTDIPVLLRRRSRTRQQGPFADPSAAWTRWRIGVAPSARLAVAGVGVAGGRKTRWRTVLGPVEKLNIVFNPRSNWRLEPKGSADELDVVTRAIEIVREAHPYIQ